MVLNKFLGIQIISRACVCVCLYVLRPSAAPTGSSKTTEEVDSLPSSRSSSKAAGSDPYRYKMDYPYIGTCLIINNKNFHRSTSKYTCSTSYTH